MFSFLNKVSCDASVKVILETGRIRVKIFKIKKEKRLVVYKVKFEKVEVRLLVITVMPH